MTKRRMTGAERSRRWRERRRKGLVEVAPSAPPRPRAVDALLEMLGASIPQPAMPDAACRGHADLFDPRRTGESSAEHEPEHAVAARHLQAQRLCAGCLELTRCRDWVQQLPAKERPTGVVAGRIIETTRKTG